MSTAVLHLDFETYSDLSVTDVGAFRYSEDASTEVLIACYALNDAEVRCWLPFKSPPPAALLALLADPSIRVAAHNAQFEYAVYHNALRRQYPQLPRIPHKRWLCTALLAASCGLPRSLDGATRTMRLSDTKNPEGKALIKMFCGPRKPTKADGRVRIKPLDERDAFNRFIVYCKDDVKAERALHATLPPLTLALEQAYVLDLKMNERGLPLDMPMVKRALPIVKELQHRITKRVEELSGGIRPTQRDRMLDVFRGMGIELENLQANTVHDLLADDSIHIPASARTMLELRVEASKASTKKLARMLTCVSHDGRARGMFLIHGAHTGRYAGRLIQPQNFIRGSLKLPAINDVFTLLEYGDADMFEAIYDRPLDTISQVMRGFISAHNGHVISVVDYAAIEARVLAWLAEHTVLLNAFRKGVDVYRMMAALVFGIRIEQVTDDQRRIGKNLVLGCGYGLGKAKFVVYCAKNGVIITDEFSERAVNGYRANNQPIVNLWYAVEQAAVTAVHEGRTLSNPVRVGRLAFYVSGVWLVVLLPSGRCIRYPYPKVKVTERFGNPALQLSFWAGNYRESTYGGKLVENAVQAISYDIMAAGMQNAEGLYAPVSGTVHDEIISEQDRSQADITRFEQLVCTMPAWAGGIPLTAKGFVCDPRYRKD
jgi:DNA polymerase